MFRIIDLHLKQWKMSSIRKPLLLRGARQVGKTFAVRKLGQSFKQFIEINFEETPHLKKIFGDELDLDPARIIRDLSFELNIEIIPGETLLFIDEVQIVPRAIIALRYFYEKMPELHVIAAGSLLDFAIEKVGVPVGRIMFLHLYPMSWIEFLKALGYDLILKSIITRKNQEPESEVVHNKILEVLREYLAVGGMPEVVDCWSKTKDIKACAKIHQAIIQSYRQDFGKYAREHQIKYVELLFEAALQQLGKKFKFSKLNSEFRKRELSPALDLLVKAGVIHRVRHSSGQGLPLGAGADFEHYKIIFLDIGLSQALLGLDLVDWFLNPDSTYLNKGSLIEAFVGQELLVYCDPHLHPSLYYWQREVKGSEAEIDYLTQLKGQVIPIEVKSEKGNSLKSMHLFLESHPNSSFGIRFSTHNFSVHEKIKSYPLYAIPLAVHWQVQELENYL